MNFFGCWNAAKQALLEEGRVVGLPLDALFARWERSGAFMHSANHPALPVIADIARALAKRAKLSTLIDAPEYYLNDPMLEKGVWPVYPEIADRLGVPGGYAFKAAQPPGADATLFGLDEFIARSFEAYASMQSDALACARLDHPAYRDLESIAAAERKQPRTVRADSPYANLPSSQFWRRAVERVPAASVDPVGTPPFAIDRRVRIATAGSCFAQNMSCVLVRHGYDYFVAEPAPPELSADAARDAGYGVFSTRCGNVYTARQLLQLFDRAYGTFVPREPAWLRPDGRHADPFRPQIEPAGFATGADVLESRERHLAAVRTMFERLDVLIFTLGLTEAWRSTADGAVFPLAPGVVAGCMDFARYEFVNFTASEVRADLEAFLARLERVNATARVVLTVSPQPPIATYEPRHVLVSSTYTKAALRVACDEVERTHPAVWYFPGYELVAGGFNRGAYFEDDLRTVTAEGIDHVMRLFFEHGSLDAPWDVGMDALQLAENEANMDVVCDEEAIVEPARAPHWDEYGVFLTVAQPHQLIQDDAGQGEGSMDALQPPSMRAPLQAAMPGTMTVRTTATIACTIRNDGDVPLASGGKHPVFLCYRWYDPSGTVTEVGQSIHTPLPGVLESGASVKLTMRVAAPRFEGRYRLRLALLQSEVAWFDDVDPA
ncbi:MAG: GSCFA domain-containing protein, partial [Candidatus Eremiobacteraeota bacterium]|nr:GSCFA domain-containing protein [Candidatus Eremiobacteraeota bacterium]